MGPPAGLCCRQGRYPNRAGISAYGKPEWSGTICAQFLTNQNDNSWVKACVWVDSPVWGPGRMVADLVCCRPAIAVLRACRPLVSNQSETQRPNFGSNLDVVSCWWFSRAVVPHRSDPKLDFDIGSQIRSVHFGFGTQSRTPNWTAKWALMLARSWVHKRAPSGARLLIFKDI